MIQGTMKLLWPAVPLEIRFIPPCCSDSGALCHTNPLTGHREKEYCILGAEPFLTVIPVLPYQYRGPYRAGSCPYFVLNYAI